MFHSQNYITLHARIITRWSCPQIGTEITCKRIFHAKANERLIRLYLVGGAWSQAATRLTKEARSLWLWRRSTPRRRAASSRRDDRGRATPTTCPPPPCTCRPRSRLDPDDVAALRAFRRPLPRHRARPATTASQGRRRVLPRRRAGRASGRRQGRLNLLRRAMSLRPNHHEAGNALAGTR